MASASVTLPVPSTSLIGRDGELRQLASALADPQFRIVTLTGPPGVGKTRLALVAAAAAVSRFADGAVFVDLTHLPREGSVLEEIARAVGGGHAVDESEGERLIESLASRELLLVIDNCEHVLPMPSLAAIVAGCPHLRVLATSRERLRLTAEREIAVETLQVPEASDLDDPERIAAKPAVQLLVARAQATRSGLAVTADNSADVADVCRRLDGLPLALELAAAQLKVFTPGELAYRLRHRSTLLAGGLHDMPARHEGLRTAISWSHTLMADHERRVFRRLAVFVGGWTLPAAEAVCVTADDAAVDIAAAMTSLLDKSVISRSTRADGVTVFTMLQSVREFAAGELKAHGEVEATRRRHAEFYLGLAIDAERGIGTPDEEMWWMWLGYEHGELRAALDHSLSAGDSATALQLATNLGWYTYTRGGVGEGRLVVSRALDAVGTDDRALAAPMAAILLVAGILSWSQGDLDPATRQLTRSVQLSEAADDTRRVAIATAFLGHAAREAGNLDTAARHYRRARGIFEDSGDPRGIAWSQFDLGMLAWRRGEMDEAERLLADSADRFRGLGYGWAIATALWGLGCVDVGRGDVESGTRNAVRALDEFERVDDRRGLAQAVELIARIASMLGKHETAGRLLGAVAATRRALAASATANESDVRERAEQDVRQALGPERAERAAAAGRALPHLSVLALARRVLGAVGADGTDNAGAARPTPREREVAALVAAGRTNRQVGRALGIAEKTVEVHVRNLLGKLGVQSRAEIAVWAVSHGVYDPEVAPG